MSFFTAVTNLIIRPLELLFEFLFSIVHMLIGNSGITICFLSLAINLLVMPLYKRADAMQEEVRNKNLSMEPWVKHIKKNFSGDERYMILQSYYRHEHFKPTDTLKGSVSLLLEVPFFMAAYQFLSNLDMLNGQSFGPIQDLGQPDGMLVIGSLAINLLPILMTLLNLISGYIYTKGFPLKEKLQLYGMAMVFLVLLYPSPSGLVFYWTLNNLFSLIKNIVLKFKNPRKVINTLCSLFGFIAMVAVILLKPFGSPRRQIFVLGILLLLQLPLFHSVFKSRLHLFTKSITISKKDSTLFILSSLFSAVLTGLLIPSAVIANSPTEFLNVTTLTNPIFYIVHTFLISAGVFLVWIPIFYILSEPTGKKILNIAVFLFSLVALTNYMFFGKNYGNLSSNMKFDVVPVPLRSQQLINLFVLSAVICIGLLILTKKQELIRFFLSAAAIALCVMALINFPGIFTAAKQETREILQNQNIEASIPLSKNGKNVIVLMMDRAVGLNIPFILNEKPQLKEQFQGFTFYPKTLSHGMNTNIGSPALCGGYEYTPEQMNLRTEETLQQKHDEALKVMPVLFDNAGYEVTVFDPPLAGYAVIPQSEVFKDYPQIHVSNLMMRYAQVDKEIAETEDQKTIRRLFCYSIFKSAPVFAQPVLYSRGAYNDPDEILGEHNFRYGLGEENGQITNGTSLAFGFNPVFMQAYRELEALEGLTKISDSNENTFLFLANNTPHEAMMLQMPDYLPSMSVNNQDYDARNTDRFIYKGHKMLTETPLQMSNYHSNMAYMLKLGQWFDYLRQQGVYDNTRIIIAADHGRDVYHFPELTFDSKVTGDILHFNPVLLIKDFGSNEDISTDLTFMTNADVPSLAMDGLIPNPVNPFTGKEINCKPKQKPQIILDSFEHCGKNNSYHYLEAEWFRINGDMFDSSNWECLGEASLLPQH